MKSKFFTILLLCFWALGVNAQSNEPIQFSWTNLPNVQQPAFKKDTFNIVRYGAVADGISLNTVSINKAISQCSAKGGGIVLVPGGLWLTGPVEMKSNVNLHIVRDAILLFTSNFNQY